MSNTNNENTTPAVTNEEYEKKIKELEKQLKASEKEREAQAGVIKEQEATLKAQAEELEKGKTAPEGNVAVPQKSYVSEENHATYKTKLGIDRQLGDKVVVVNDRYHLIKRGVDVEIPEWVQEVLDHEEEMELADYNHQDKINARLNMF